MRNLMKKFLVVLTFSLLSLGVASASDVACSISGTSFGAAVNSSTAVSCGPLTFNSFVVQNATGGAAGLVDVLASSYFDTVTGTAFMLLLSLIHI